MVTRASVLILALGTTACTKHWDLKVTEVGRNEVELYLDRPASDNFSLRGMTLTWAGQSGAGGQVDLGSLATTLGGGKFLVVWEDAGHSGAPEAAEYRSGQAGPVPGIKVPVGFFSGIDAGPGLVGVSGRRTDAFVVTHRVADLVRFGLPPADRPVGSGSFRDTGVIGVPTGSAGPQRRWSNGAPVDSDSEDDWTWGFNSWGVPTP